MRDRDLRPLVPGADPPLPPRSGTLVPRPRRASLQPSPGRGSTQSPARRGLFPGYLLSRQAIHSAEEEEWATCAATMMGSGARRPPAAATSRARSAAASSPPRPPRGPAPPGPPRAQRPAGLGAGEGGGPEGRDAGTALHCGARGWGVPRSRPLQGGGLGATPGGRPPATGDCCVSGRPEPTPHLGASEAWRGEGAAGGGGGTGVSVYVFFIQQMPLKWLLPLCFLRNPLVSLCSCQNLLAVSCSPLLFPLSKGMERRAILAWAGDAHSGL